MFILGEPVEIEESNNELQTNIKEEMSLVEIYAERERTIRESKIAIATACEEILEDPESNVYDIFCISSSWMHIN